MNYFAEFLRLAQVFAYLPIKVAKWASMKITADVNIWDPLSLLDCNKDFALVILNQPLLSKKERITLLWNRAAIRATVDGGTTEWFKFLDTVDMEIEKPIPDLVTGDFDSVEPHTLNFYRSQGAKVICTPEQDETDFQKCVRCLAKELVSRGTKVNHVITLVEMSGRFDHIMANVNVLFHGAEMLGVPLFQMSSDTLTWILAGGRHKINIDERVFDGWCGFIPVGHPVYVTTTGLKWNMTCQRLEFGGFISTSNQFTTEHVVTVEIDRPILFTMGIPLT